MNTEIWEKCWLPVMSGIALLFACRMAQPSHKKAERIGKIVSREGYFGYIVLSLGVLLIPPLLPPWNNSMAPVFWWPFDLAACHFLVHDLTHRFIRLKKPLNPNHPGFPSGHTMFAFALAWLLYERYPYLAPVGFAAATLIGWSRVQVQAHYAYQVLGGAALGIALGVLVSHRTGGVFLPRCLWPGWS